MAIVIPEKVNLLEDPQKWNGAEDMSCKYNVFRLAAYLKRLYEFGYFYLEQEEQWETKTAACFRHIVSQKNFWLSFRQNKGKDDTWEEWMEIKNEEPGEENAPAEARLYALVKELALEAGIVWQKGTPLELLSPQGLKTVQTDSLYTTLYRNKWTQSAAGTETIVSGQLREQYWAAKFYRDVPGEGTRKYLYLGFVTAYGIRRKNLPERLYKKTFCAYSDENLQAMTFPDGASVNFQELMWIKKPLDFYYALPTGEVHAEQGEDTQFETNMHNLCRLFHRLEEEGYEYRQEMLRCLGVDTESSFVTDMIRNTVASHPKERDKWQDDICNMVAEIEMEFVSLRTGDHCYVKIDDSEIHMMIHNSGEFGGFDHPSFNREPEPGDRIKLPRPVFADLMKQYHLIRFDNLIIACHSAEKECYSWFYEPTGMFWDREEDIEMLELFEQPTLDKEELESEVGRMRRVFKFFRYEMAERLIWNGDTLETFTDGKRRRAFCIVYNANSFRVKYIDPFMDVERTMENLKLGHWDDLG
ncbi:MAG: hypothetical protein IJ794_05300 [Lachnospiraceae bacterium]|nr:hypothetical protein [Lachnospiraceae bacterium]